MLGSGKTGTVRALVTASSTRSRDTGIYRRRYAVGLYRQALLTRGDPALAEHVACDVIVNDRALARIPERGEDDARYRLPESVLRRCRQVVSQVSKRVGYGRHRMDHSWPGRGIAHLIGNAMSRSADHAVGLFVTSCEERDGCVIAALRGGLDITSAPALREKLLGLLRPGASRLVVDLSAVGYADASGFAVLVGAGRRAGLLGGWLRLASPTPEVARVLSATGLDRHLATFPTMADAIIGRRPDVGTAEAGTGTIGYVAPIRPAAALPARHAAGRPSWATDRDAGPLAGVRR